MDYQKQIIRRTMKNPGAAATATGAGIKSEGTKLQRKDTPENEILATSFFWDRASNSVQPLAEVGGAV